MTTSTGLRRPTQARHETLMQYVRGGVTRVEDLAAEMGVSESTVRRDLTYLSRAGQLTRTYGGATVDGAGVFHELVLAERMSLRSPAKAAIGRLAAGLVPDGGTIFLDAGSTTMQLAGQLNPEAKLTVVTRGLELALMLAGAPHLEVVLLGGTVVANTHGVVGPLTDTGFDRFHFDVVFLGVDELDPVAGVGEATAAEARTKELAAQRARRTVVLADATKLTSHTVPSWAPLPAGWILITDETDNRVLDRYREAGVEVIVAEYAE
ncbi:MAG: DeoR/GlpR family DNA-binding transcription regulator, partial [Cellulomonadaceae bacterium]|nr:DeoR/GlpR family DNA-binding transcription regulator [Cellulomonadaceae bacterium]